MPFDPSKPFTVEEPQFDPAQPFTVEPAASGFDPSQPFTVEDPKFDPAQPFTVEDPNNPPGTVLSRTVSGIPAALARGVVGLNQFAAGALKAADPFGGIFPDSSFQQAMGGAIAQGEATKQALPPNPNRNLAGEVLDTVAESLPQAIPAMGGAAAGTTLALKAMNVGVGSGAVEFFNAKRDFFSRAGVDLANPQAVAAAEADPRLNAAAEDFATRRAAVIGALDTATLGASSRIGGTGPARAAARVATEAAGGAAGEAGAQVSTEGKVTDWKNVAMEAAGEVIPGAVEVAASRRSAAPAPTAPPPPAAQTPNDWMNRPPPAHAPGAPGTSQASETAAPPPVSSAPSVPVAGTPADPVVPVAGTTPAPAAPQPAPPEPTVVPAHPAPQPAPATPLQPATPAQPPDSTAPVSNDTHVPRPPYPDSVPASIPPVSPANPEAPTASQLSPVEHPVQELPVATLRLSKDVPNFKEDARDDTGEVRGQELKGRYIRLGTAPVVVWERTNGTREIITGRHRFALARRSGERTIPAQVVREADGFTRAQALVFDAEANIRDNQGATRDYAHFFRNSGLTRAEADSRGLVSRSKGQQGASLGYDASDDLYSLYRAKKLAEPKAVAIARAAPGRADLQRVGVAAAIEDPSMSAEDLENYVSYLAANAPAPAPGMAQTDMFGADETFLKEAIRTAKAVSQIRDGIQQRLAVLKTGQRLTSGQRKQIAQDVGIQIKTPADIDAARTTLEAEADAWTRWKTDPAKISAARTRAGLPPTGPAAAAPSAHPPGAPGTTTPAVEAAAAPVPPVPAVPPVPPPQPTPESAAQGGKSAAPPLTLQSPTNAELDAEAAQRAARDTKRAQADQMAARAAAPLQGDSSGVGHGTLFAQDADLFSGPAAQDQAAAATDQAEPILTVQDKSKRTILQVHLRTLADGRFSAQYDISTNTAGVMSEGGPKPFATRQEAITAAADNIIQWVTRTRDTQGSSRTAAQDAQLNQIQNAAEGLKATAPSSPLPAPRSTPTNKPRPSRGTAAMADPFGPESAQQAARDTKRAQADQTAARAAAPLQGDSSSVGQGTLFAQDADLFSGPAAQDQAGKSAPTTSLTPDAEQLLAAAAAGAPAFVTNNMRAIAAKNGITVTGDMTPAQVIEKLQAKRDQAAKSPTPPDTAPPGDPSAPIDSIPRDFDPDPKVLNGVRTDTGKPVGTGDIIRFISKAFDIPLRTGGFRKAAEGIYRSVTEAIRLKRPNTLPVAFHELGHYLHNVVFPGRPDPAPPGDRSQEYSDFAKAFDSELLPLGRTTSTPSYTEHQVRMEGVAEFLREYMSDRANAIAIAPTFTAHFEAETAKNADLRAAIDTARQLVTKWKQQPAGARIDAQIRSSHDGRRTFTARQILANIYTKWVDQTAPINRTLDSLVETGADPGLAQAIQNRITNFIGGWRGKVEHALHNRAVNLRGVQVGEGLRAILADAEAATPARLLAPGQQPLELFRRYIVAKHALEDLMPRNIETGLLRADVQAEVASLGPVYESHFRRLIAFQKTQRDLLVDAGIITRSAANAMDAKHQWYVPFHRFHQGVAGRSMGGSGTGFVNTPTGIRRMKGSTREIIDPLETIVKNAYVFRELAERNRIGSAFARILDTTRGAGRVGDRVSKKLAPTNVGTDDIARMLEQAGVDPAIIDEVRDAGPAGQVWRAIDSVKPRDGIFKVWRNGKEQHYQIDDPELYRALTLADGVDAEILSKFPFLRTLNLATRVLRAGATLSFDFIVRNPLRDQFTAAVYTKKGVYIPFIDMFKGAYHVIGKDALYQKWVRDGGRYAHMVGADKIDLRESLDEVMSNPSAGQAIIQALNPLRVLTTLNKLSTLVEESTRVMLFQKSLQTGSTPVEAANLSKDGTLNFSRHGTHGKLINMFSAFFNAGVQDLDKFIRAHADPEQRAGVMLRGFLAITVPSILTWALSRDDDEIQRLQPWRKLGFWNFRIPGYDGIVSIPKPFLLGSIYGNSVETALDYLFKDDPQAVNQFVDSIISQLPAGGPGTKESLFIPPGLIPDLVQTAMEGLSNYSFFREGPVVPQRMQDLPKAEQYTESTSQTARAIGQATGTSPMIVDNAIRNTFAGLGKLTVQGIDAVILKLAGQEMPPRPAKPLVEQIPGLRAFVIPELEQSKYINQAYTGIHNAEAVWKAAKSKDPVADAAWFKRNREALVYYHQHLPRLRQIADDISDLNTARRKILGARNINSADKRTRLLAINKQQDLAARAALKHIRPEDTVKRR